MADEDEARATAHRLWPNEALPGELAQVLPTPAHFEQACELVEPEMLVTPVGPTSRSTWSRCASTPTRASTSSSSSRSAPSSDAFFDTWAREVLPRFA